MTYTKITLNNRLYLFDPNTQQKWRLATKQGHLHLQDAEIEAIDFSGQRLGKIPGAIFDCFNLKILILSNNHSHKLFYFSNIFSIFNLSSSQLQRLSEKFGQLKHLQTLDLSSNHLQQLPKVFGQLSQLQDLDLSQNQIHQLPQNLEQLSQLKSLNLSRNRLQELQTTTSTQKLGAIKILTNT